MTEKQQPETITVALAGDALRSSLGEPTDRRLSRMEFEVSRGDSYYTERIKSATTYCKCDK